MTLRPRIYVAGPISKGDVDANVKQAVEAGRTLLDLGYAPFVPHYSHLAEPYATVGTQRYEEWLELDFSFISVCRAVLRLPGESAGAEREVVFANSLGIPVFTEIGQLVRAIPRTS